METRLVQEADVPKLAEFLASFEGENRPVKFWENRLDHWWKKNPFFDSTCPRGWLVEDAGAIRGFLGCIPSLFQCQGVEKRVFSISTWRVEEKARTESMRLIYSAVENCSTSILFNTTPNQAVKKILSFLHFSDRFSNENQRMSILLCRGKRPLFRILRLALNIPFKILSRNAFVERARRLDPEDPAVAQALDALWSRTKDKFRFTTARTAKQIRWYCNASSSGEKFLLGYFEGEKLRATSIFCKRSWPGKEVFEQVDLWGDASSMDEFQAMAASLACRAKVLAVESGCDFIQLPHWTPGYAKVLRRLGIWISQANRSSHWYSGDLAPDEKESVFFTSIEGDRAL